MQIHSEGGRLLGLALSGNDGLTDLNIRLNRLGDVGGSALLKSLMSNSSLESLNLSSNSVGYEASGGGDMARESCPSSAVMMRPC